MKKLTLFFLFFVVGCSNLYKNSYIVAPEYNPENIVPYIGDAQIIKSKNIAEDEKSYQRKGYNFIGTSEFNSGDDEDSVKELKQVAKNVGAEIVLWSQKYTNTINGFAPYTYGLAPRRVSYYSDSARSYKTTYAGGYPRTGYMPYSLRRYNYAATFLGKIKNIRSGLLVRDLLSKERIDNHLNAGIYIGIIIVGSPASKSDLAEGDIITKINDKKIEDIDDFKILDASNIKNAKIEFLRSGKIKFTEIDF